jgi:hypothetical protein
MVTLPDEEMWSKAETGSTESTQNDLIEREQHAWARVARDLLEVEEESATDRGCDSRMRSEDKRQDAEFRKHCFGRYVFLSSPKGMPPSVAAPNYLVELLTGLIHMHEDDAKRFIKTYRRLCIELGIEPGINLGTDNLNKLRKSLNLPLEEIPVEKGMQHVSQEPQEPQELQDAQGHSNNEPQGDGSQNGDGCSEDMLHCPWPDCQHTINYTKFRITEPITIHLLAHHLNCVWQCPEPGCEYCGYLSPGNLERHRIYCHVGAPLQCGHSHCKRVFVGWTWESRGHAKYATLREHIETHFNQDLQTTRRPSSVNQAHELEQQLPSHNAYKESSHRVVLLISGLVVHFDGQRTTVYLQTTESGPKTLRFEAVRPA